MGSIGHPIYAFCISKYQAFDSVFASRSVLLRGWSGGAKLPPPWNSAAYRDPPSLPGVVSQYQGADEQPALIG